MYLARKWPYILREQHSAANFVFTFERIEKDRIYITEFMNGISPRRLEKISKQFLLP